MFICTPFLDVKKYSLLYLFFFSGKESKSLSLLSLQYKSRSSKIHQWFGNFLVSFKYFKVIKSKKNTIRCNGINEFTYDLGAGMQIFITSKNVALF